ncbi:MAG: cobalamin-dependent protein, partial [Candidatus Coatesbacteria bacterium]|nr:cobalamin-dependent protein [Candidatus Coatesbacteria bacterium]
MGPRVLSSCLKQAGYETRKLFLQIEEEKGDIPPGLFLYSDSVLEQVKELCHDALFVGVSLMTNYFDRVEQLCTFLRAKLGVPIVLGGIHATLTPKECAEFADYVCIGEGEGAIVELASAFSEGKGASSIANICCIKDGQFSHNPPRPLVANLDDIPFPDFSLDDDYVLIGERMERIDLNLLQRLMSTASPGKKTAQERPYYITMMTRGCRYACTYCCNRTLLRLYGGRAFVRRRSVENVISELSWVRENLPFVQLVVLTDDSFFDTDKPQVRAFCEAYKARIALPFFSLGTPFGIDEKKLAMMVDAGMIYLQMGIQTGSERIRKMYNRPFSNEEIISI